MSNICIGKAFQVRVGVVSIHRKMELIPAAARKTTATIATVIHELVLVSGAPAGYLSLAVGRTEAPASC